MLADLILLGTVPWWQRKVSPIERCRQLFLRILRVELCHGLDIQYCSDLHRSQTANEQA
jgi:hypothetical protein